MSTAQDKQLWFKCYSTNKKLLYFWNPITNKSIWEEDSAQFLNHPNVFILDQTEDMKKGKVPVYIPPTEPFESINKIKKEQSPTTSLLKSKLPNVSENDDDDEEEVFNDTIKEFIETSQSSSSILNGSIASEKARVKSAINQHEKGSANTVSASTMTPPTAVEANASQSKFVKKGLQKPPLGSRHKTPIQDRKLKEKEQLLMKQKQKNKGAPNLPDLVMESCTTSLHPGSQPLLNGDSKMKKLGNFIIPRRKMSASTSDKESGTGSFDSSSPLASPPRPKSPPKVTEKAKNTIRPINRLVRNERSSAKPPEAASVSTPPPAIQAVEPGATSTPFRKTDSSTPLCGTAQETATSHFKNPSQIPIPRRIVKASKPPAREGDNEIESTVGVQETVSLQFKDPSPILPQNFKRVVKSEKNNVTNSSSNRAFCNGTGEKKRRNNEDSHLLGIRKLRNNGDSDSSVTTASTRTRISMESANETTTRPAPVNSSSASESSSFVTTASKRTRISMESANETTTRPAPVAGNSPVLGEPSFDARQLLERRRSKQSETSSKPSCSNQEDNTMEWEASESREETCNKPLNARLGAARLAQACMSNLKFKPIVIVVDTNALIHHREVVEDLFSGSLLGLTVSIVVPYKVLRELDYRQHNCANKVAQDGARAAVRMINEALKDPLSYNLTMQNSNMDKQKAKNHFELKDDDDFILNCALQQKLHHGSNREVLLLTDDRHLQIHAFVEDLKVTSPVDLKGWARKYKEEVRLETINNTKDIEGPKMPAANPVTELVECTQPGGQTDQMDIDPDPEEQDPDPDSNLLASSSQLSLSTGSERLSSLSPRFCAEALSYDLLTLFKSVLEKFNERLYGNVKKHASQPRPSWTLIKHIQEVSRRWDALTERKMSPEIRDCVRRIIGLVKETNNRKDEFTKDDMRLYFTCCQTLAEELKKHYEEDATSFLTRLAEMLEEWEQKAVSTAMSLSEDDDPQPADVALQNIYNCMRTDYELLKERVEQEGNKKSKKGQLENCLKRFRVKVQTILRVIQRVMELKPLELNIENMCVFDFVKETCAFQVEEGKLLTFELNNENVVTMFKEDNLRQVMVIMEDKFRRLQLEVWNLILGLNSSDDSDDEMLFG